MLCRRNNHSRLDMVSTGFSFHVLHRTCRRANLEALYSMQDTFDMVTHRNMSLQRYDFSAKHRSCKFNAIPYILSRVIEYKQSKLLHTPTTHHRSVARSPRIRGYVRVQRLTRISPPWIRDIIWFPVWVTVIFSETRRTQALRTSSWLRTPPNCERPSMWRSSNTQRMSRTMMNSYLRGIPSRACHITHPQQPDLQILTARTLMRICVTTH